MTAEGRRDQLIQVAIDLFAKNGFDGTTTKSIAAKAGVSEAIIFRHFATKDDLYTAILDHKGHESGVEAWLEEIRACAERNDDEALFRSLAEKILESYRRDPQFQRLMFYSSLDGHALSRVFHKKRGLPIYQFLLDYITRRQREGAFRKCDPGAAVFALVSMPTYYSIVRSLFGMDLLDTTDSELTATFTALLLDGLRNGKTVRREKKR